MPCNVPHTERCQFKVPETELIDIGQRQKRCIYHIGLFAYIQIPDGNIQNVKKQVEKQLESKVFITSMLRNNNYIIARRFSESEKHHFNKKLDEYLVMQARLGTIIDLTSVAFPEDTDPDFLKKADISNGLVLNGAVSFNKVFNLTGREIPYFSCYSANLYGLDLNDSRFTGEANFLEARIGTINCKNTEFDRINMCNAIFKGESRFNNAKFHQSIAFDQTTFMNAHFDGAYFGNTAFFRNSIYIQGISFYKATFKGPFDFSIGERFSHEQLLNSVELRPFTSPLYPINFNEARFEEISNFEKREFTAITSFRKCYFNKAPIFFGVGFYEDVTFSGSIFKDFEYGSRNRYRHLKSVMASVKNRYDEGTFFACEQRCLRNDTSIPIASRLLSLMYDTLSEYGQNIAKPFRGILYLWIGCGLFYATMASPSINPSYKFDWILLCKSMRFSFDQMILPFNASKISHIPFPKHTARWAVELIANLESIFFLALLSLLLLAIRWWFKRD